MGIRVSVICTTYNQKNYIKKCLESLVSQNTSFEYEILVHDDASTDGTRSIVEDFEKRYPKIRAFYEEENQHSKRIKFRPKLIAESRGDYLAFCEGDDYWADPNKLQKQFDALESNPSCSISTHRVRRVRSDGTETDSIIEQNFFKAGVINGHDYLKTYLDCHPELLLQTSSFFVRKKVYVARPAALRGFNVGDVPMMIWATYNGDMYYFEDIMSCYRMFASGSTSVSMRKNTYALKRTIANVNGFLAFNDLSHSEFWDAMKHRVSYEIVQSYYGTKGECFKDKFNEAKKELSLKEIITAKIKFSSIGEILRRVIR